MNTFLHEKLFCIAMCTMRVTMRLSHSCTMATALVACPQQLQYHVLLSSNALCNMPCNAPAGQGEDHGGA
jgi:hypothetical protein